MLKFFTILFKKNTNFRESQFYKWNDQKLNFEKIKLSKIIPLSLLKGIDEQKNLIKKNTIKFAEGFKTNNALLWGVRGNGKSTLIKSTFNELSNKYENIKLIELNKDNIQNILEIYKTLENNKKFRFIIFIDDLSFEKSDSEYKSVKSMLDGTLAKQPDNIIIYATSNRRHLMPEDMINNEKSSAIHTNENIEEKISLSDRFGLWIGFHNISQNDYINIIKSYCDYLKIDYSENDIKRSLEWSLSRGNRTGRSAWQFIIELASNKKITINF